MRRSFLAAAAAVAVTALATAGLAPAASAATVPGASPAPHPSPTRAVATVSTLPRGWSLVSTPSGLRLRWTSPTRIPMGDARVDVLAGGAVLGSADVAPDGRTVTVPLPAGVRPDQLRGLEASAAGRRLDVAPARAAAPSPAAATAAPLPLTRVDPGKPGPYRTRTGEYSLPGLRVPGFPAPVEVRAVVVAPRGTKGARPFVLFLHGRHFTCYKGADINGDWPCRAGYSPVPSYRGYLQTQQLLASQGYVTVSISANGINGQDYLADDGGAEARSVLVRHHLALWASWAGKGRSGAPAVVKAAPVADLRRVLLVGHSRGGEGVNRAALDSELPVNGRAARWHISGLAHLAPTAFGQNPAPGVPAAVVLPSCDGDVYDLQGQQYVDRMRDLGSDPSLRSSVLVVGADHNFFNSEWTPGVAKAPAEDDWGSTDDPVCGKKRGNVRLTPAEQRAVGATYVAAAARAFLARDTRVFPLLDGSGVRPASAGGARVLTHALGARRSLLTKAGADAAVPAPRVTRTGSVSASVCEGFRESGETGTCPALLPAPGVYPHFDAIGVAGEPAPRAIAIRWTRASGIAAVAAQGGRASVAGATALAMRVVVPAGSHRVRFRVSVVDARGRAAPLGTVALDGLPASQDVGANWAQEVRLPLGRVRGVDRARITTLRLAPVSSSGRLLLLDAWGWRNGAGTRPSLLPRLDVPSLTVKEGSNGTRTASVTLRASGPGAGVGVRRFFLGVYDDRAGQHQTKRVVTLTRGRRTLTVKITYQGNTLHDDDVRVPVAIKPVVGLVAGDWFGGLTILDDDPQPAVSVTPIATAVTEGSSLVWRFTQAGPSHVDTFIQLAAAPPADGPELSTADVPASWISQWLGEAPNPPVAFSAVPVYVNVDIPPGSTSADLQVPTVADGVAEGTESLVWQVQPEFEGGDLPGLPSGTTLTGTVSDPA
jgi:hypothetical protein